ncbi:hypothetical protein Hanom_Chr10g00877591 [Helianthus anomalus]
MPHFSQSGQTMPLFPIPDMQASPIRCTACHPLLGMSRTLQRRSSWSLARIDDDIGLCYFYMTQYCTNNLIFMF